MLTEPLYEPRQLIEDPFPIYRRLRDEEPMYRHPSGEFCVLSRYDDVQAAARDWETFSSAEGNDLDDTSLLFAPGELTHADPPLHTRLRNSVRREFGVSAVRAALEPVARTKVDALVGRLREGADVDLAKEVADALPASMICSWLGFPEADHPQLIAWFRAMIERVPLQLTLPDTALQARDDLRAYLRGEMRRRRGGGTGDLLSAVVGAHEAQELSESEAVGVTILLFLAGVTTTSALLSGILLYLGQHPGQLEQLRVAPEIIPDAVEEFLRFDAPIQWLTRLTTRRVQLHGVMIERGERVLLVWGSANRDERRWERPDEVIFDRAAKRHIAFGEGIHHCLGAPLARLEARILLEQFVPAVASYAITGPVKRQYTQSERTIASLPATFEWAPEPKRRDGAES